MVRLQWMAGFALACLLTAGCQNSTPTTPAQSGDGGEVAGETVAEGTKTPGQEAVKPALPVLEGIDSFEGNWALSPFISRRLVNFWLFRLSPDENGKWSMEGIMNQPMMGTFTAGNLKIDGDQIRFDAQIANPKAQVKLTKISFEGTLKDGKVHGNLMFSDSGMLVPAELLPTDAETLADYQDAALIEGTGDFESVMKEPDPARGLWKAARERTDSPLAVEAYGFLFGQIHQWNLKEEEIQRLAADYSQALGIWGKRMQGVSEVTAGMNLARSKKSLDIAEELLTNGEGRLEDATPAKSLIEGGRLHLRIARDLQALPGKDEAAAAAAYADLQELVKQFPYTRPDLMLATAEYAEKHQDPDTAIRQYLTLVGIPMLERMALSSRISMVAGDPTPSSALKALWIEKHGALDGLDAALAETYHTQVEQVLEALREKAPPFPEKGNRIVLTEVFTGTFCDACIASDLALDLLIKTQPADRSIVICYHQHNPGPDPLTGTDSEQRSSYYSIQGTPAAYVNGAQLERVGGLFSADFIRQSYHQYRNAIDYFMDTETKIVIEPKAEVVDGKLTVTVPPIQGISEADINQVRLRLAIVEDQVDYIAPNGLRHHPMVVRTMLGGALGISAKQGELKYHLPMPVAELKGRQLGYLMQFEHGKRMKFPVKPAEFKPLRLVAFVQHEKTKQVLQAAWTPVTGEWEYPEFKFADPDDHSHPASETPADKSAADKSAPEQKEPEAKESEKTPAADPATEKPGNEPKFETEKPEAKSGE